MGEQLKCSGVRHYKGKLDVCAKIGKLEMNGFCSLEHDNDAKKYAGVVAYDEHVANFKRVSINKSLTHVFNNRVRPVFGSIVMAGWKKEEEEFVQNASSSYMETAKSAWDSTKATVESDKAKQFSDSIKQIADTRRSIKRKQDEEYSVKALTDTQEEEPMPLYESPKKTRLADKAKEVVEVEDCEDEEEEEAEDPNKAVDEAAKMPLPDDGEDMDYL